MTVDPALETRRPEPSGPGPWLERHRVVVRAEHGPLALVAQVAIHLPSRSASFQCAVLGVDDRPIVIAQDEIVAPDRAWEFRASGLWVDFVCEDPLVHWSYGLEAFAIAVDGERELLDRGYGERVPLGWEFDIVTEPAAAVADPVADARPSTDARPPTDAIPASSGGYRTVGRAEGLLLLASSEQAFDGWAERRHEWGQPADLRADLAAGDSVDVAADVAVGGGPGTGPPPSGFVALPTPVDVLWFGIDDDGDPACRVGPAS